MIGYAEELKGRTWLFRSGPLTKGPGDPYTHAAVFHVPNGGTEGHIKGFHSASITSEAIGCAAELARALGYTLLYMRMKDSPYTMRATQGPNGELRMGKTHDTIKAMKAKDHQTPSGGIDQAKVCESIDTLNALAKGGKTKTTFFQQGEWMDEHGTIGFEGIVRGVVVSD